MSIFIVAYDQHKPGQNYAALGDELSKFGARFLRSDWIVDVDQSAAQLRDVVLSYMDSNDELFVIEVSPEATWAAQYRRSNPGLQLLKRWRP